ncbi:MAG TPA: VOC family protein [Aridibacter sp.]|nr:VOC family protein [Aridibacter sp.]
MTQAIPDEHKGLIPHLVCDDCAGAIEFYKEAFGATEISRAPAPDGKRIIHAEIRIDKNPFFLNDDFPEFCGGKESSPKALGGTPVTIHRYVEDCDAAVDRAAGAGATVTMPPTDMFWGDRYGMVVDPYGHQWSIATHVKDLTPEEMEAGMNESFAAGAGE